MRKNLSDHSKETLQWKLIVESTLYKEETQMKMLSQHGFKILPQMMIHFQKSMLPGTMEPELPLTSTS